MRPALHWLRTLILLTTVMLTMGKAAWALESPATLSPVVGGWTCGVDDAQSQLDLDADQGRHTFSGGDDDRGELLMPITPWQPTVQPDTHPSVMPDHQPPLPWLSLPLRPPQR